MRVYTSRKFGQTMNRGEQQSRDFENRERCNGLISQELVVRNAWYVMQHKLIKFVFSRPTSNRCLLLNKIVQLFVTIFTPGVVA